jgi:hypothetical protein
MRAAGWTTLAVLLLAGALAEPALGANRSIDARISVHVRSDYRFAYAFTERDDPDCPITYDVSSQVVADVTTDRPARYRITRVRGPRGGGYDFRKHLGGQREDRGIDTSVTMTRAAQGGSSSPCGGHHTYPQNACGTRSWPMASRVGVGREPDGSGFVLVSLDESNIGLEEGMALDEWRNGGCGYDTTSAQVYITQTRNEHGRITPAYTAPISLRRLMAPRPRVMRLRDTHTFVVGDPHRFGGGYTEVRTVEVTIRKLRRR